MNRSFPLRRAASARPHPVFPCRVLLGAVLLAFGGLAPVQADDGLVVVGYGGAGQKAQEVAFFQPFTQQTGIPVVQSEYNGEMARIKVMADTGHADWDLVYQVHVEGAYKVTRAAWPHLREQAYGRVVFTSSTSGIYGNFGQSNYGMAKLGLYGLTRTLALEGRKNNILVNAIAPTGGTRMTEGLIPPQVFEQLKPELVSPLVVYLGSSACEDTSGLYEVGGGWIGKVRWERSLGFGFDPKAGFDAEDVAAHWQQICDFENAAHPADNVEALREMMANLQKHAL